MSISTIKLTKSETTKVNISKVAVALGWDVNKGKGGEFDLDAGVFLLNANGKLAKDSDFVFYGNKKSADGKVVHSGDNLTGKGDGDDEIIMVDLDTLPASVEELIFVVNIYQGRSRGQTFGSVENAFIRVYDQVTKQEGLIYDLDEKFSDETAVMFGRFYRDGASWLFEAIGTAERGSFDTYISRYKN